MRTAIALSLNSCAVQTSDLVTQDVGMEYCEKLGISTLVTNKVVNGKTYSDNTKTLALGGLKLSCKELVYCKRRCWQLQHRHYRVRNYKHHLSDHQGQGFLCYQNKFFHLLLC